MYMCACIYTHGEGQRLMYSILHSLPLCVSVSLCICTCTVHVYVVYVYDVPSGGQRKRVGASWLSIFFLETKPLDEPGALLATRRLQWFSCIHPLWQHEGGRYTSKHILLFMWVLRIWTQALRNVNKCSYLLSKLLSAVLFWGRLFSWILQARLGDPWTSEFCFPL